MGSITDATILHHVGIVLISLWLLNSYDCCHPVAYFVSLIYLYVVHEGYILKLRKKLQFEENRDANKRRVLLDSETIRWLNHVVDKMWLVCMEEIVSQKILLPLAPWFLKKYKPWTAKDIEIQHFYLGRSPPVFTEIRVLQNSNTDDHLVLEIGMNFRTADDMSAILGVKLRKRLGFGMCAKLHMLGMHIEGKVLIGVKFLRQWPFIGRLRVCFAGPPYFQMTIKPIFPHGLDVTEVPGISGWIDNLLALVFEQTLVEPNMLVVDVEKFVSPQSENWFSVDAKDPIAHAIVEVIEGAEMKPSDLNGLADPYVKGQLGPIRFRTKTKKKTLSPKWLEEFKIPICSWDSQNTLLFEVRDKDHVFDDMMGNCSVNINELRDGQRHDIWLPLQNIKMGRLHIAVTVSEVNGKTEYIQKHAKDIGVKVKLRLRHGKAKFGKGLANFIGVEPLYSPEGHDGRRKRVSFETEPSPRYSEADYTQKGSDDFSRKDFFSPRVPEKSAKVADDFEPVDVEGHEGTKIWIHHPGSEVAQMWQPRKGKIRHQNSHNLNTQVEGEVCENDSSSSSSSSSSSDENMQSIKQQSKDRVRRGLRKIGSIFHKDKGPGAENSEPSPKDNVGVKNVKKTGVRLIIEDAHVPQCSKLPKDGENECLEENGVESPHGNMKHKAKSILKQAGQSARELRSVLSRKRSMKLNADQQSQPTGKDLRVETVVSDNDISTSIDDNPAEAGLHIPGARVHSPSSVSDTDSFKSKDRSIQKVDLSGNSSGDYSFNSKDNVIQERTVSADNSFESADDTILTGANSGDNSSKTGTGAN